MSDERRVLLPPRIACLSSIDFHRSQITDLERGIDRGRALIRFHMRELKRWRKLLELVKAAPPSDDE